MSARPTSASSAAESQECCLPSAPTRAAGACWWSSAALPCLSSSAASRGPTTIRSRSTAAPSAFRTRRPLQDRGPAGTMSTVFWPIYNLGGCTNIFFGNMPRMHPAHFERDAFGGVSRRWPLTYADLEPYYLEAERRLSISGNSEQTPFAGRFDYPLPPHRLSPSDRACATIFGHGSVTQVPTVRPSRPIGKRPQCCATNQCDLCPIDSKGTALNMVYPALEGRVEIETGLLAIELHCTGGRVTAVTCVDAKRGRQRIHAREFVVACNGIDSCLLLQRSPDVPKLPSLGRHYMDHPVFELAIYGTGVDTRPGYGDSAQTGMLISFFDQVASDLPVSMLGEIKASALSLNRGEMTRDVVVRDLLQRAIERRAEVGGSVRKHFTDAWRSTLVLWFAVETQPIPAHTVELDHISESGQAIPRIVHSYPLGLPGVHRPHAGRRSSPAAAGGGQTPQHLFRQLSLARGDPHGRVNRGRMRRRKSPVSRARESVRLVDIDLSGRVERQPHAHTCRDDATSWRLADAWEHPFQRSSLALSDASAADELVFALTPAQQCRILECLPRPRPYSPHVQRPIDGSEQSARHQTGFAMNRGIRFVLVVGLALAGACSAEKSANPLSPAVAGPIAGVDISAPRLMQPGAGVTVKDTEQPIKLYSRTRPPTVRGSFSICSRWPATPSSRPSFSPWTTCRRATAAALRSLFPTNWPRTGNTTGVRARLTAPTPAHLVGRSRSTSSPLPRSSRQSRSNQSTTPGPRIAVPT